ncbi:glycosyltransferase family 4 protein [Micrococcus luteus]|uniref:Glycosyltransferase family 4 protein n=1 Tax=Micrococcus luteus TaxID=1270 RepID=A0AAP3ET75_MICLU|nr:glycosyltransferase family 4 protein [Micrococcus luteus]MCV7588239.1 glycosyltransferase family 4 protein [Micrococcus luteus]MCV7629229.1 glycosyltransferase family 4 protein [Micrococcus luteus]
MGSASAVPWRSNLGVLAQTVAEHAVDDPILLTLQGARRLPEHLRGTAARGLTTLGTAAGGVPAAVGFHMLGATEDAQERLAAAEGIRYAPARADVLVHLSAFEDAAAVLEAVPPASRGAAWHAAASRLAHHTGDLDAAVRHARVHRRNRALARRMAGEREALTGDWPTLPRETGYTPRPGRVLHVLTNSLPHTRSGYAQRSHAILRAQAEAGLQVSAVTRPGYPVQVGVPWARAVDVVDGIEYHRLTPSRLAQGQAARVRQHAALLLELVRAERPALLHTTTHYVNAMAVCAVAEACGIPWVYEVRGRLADTWAATRGPAATASPRYAAFTAREAQAARAADAVVTLGEGMRQTLVTEGVDPERIVLAPNAVDARFEAPPPSRATARNHLGLDPDGRYVGTVSSIVDYEGLDLLVRAAARLAPEHPRLRLRIVGDGVALPGLRVLAHRLGIADICEFPGRVAREDAVWHHSALDVFCVPRRDLPVTRAVTPMKSVEASAIGRPVVASDLPALAELVEDGVTGELFRAEDLDAFVAALGRLLSRPEEAERLGRAGRDWALATRTWSSNVTRYRDLYTALGVTDA